MMALRLESPLNLALELEQFGQVFALLKHRHGTIPSTRTSFCVSPVNMTYFAYIHAAQEEGRERAAKRAIARYARMHAFFRLSEVFGMYSACVPFV